MSGYKQNLKSSYLLTDPVMSLPSAANNACVQPYKPDDPSQKWQLQESTGTIANLVTHRVLDVAGGNPYPGAQITAWLHHGGLHQHWIFDHL